MNAAQKTGVTVADLNRFVKMYEQFAASMPAIGHMAKTNKMPSSMQEMASNPAFKGLIKKERHVVTRR